LERYPLEIREAKAWEIEWLQKFFSGGFTHKPYLPLEGEDLPSSVPPEVQQQSLKATRQ
jgi:hypothetical protein